jgi:hypothetical protein
MAKKLFYLHCLIATGCAGLAVYVLDRRAEDGWQFDRQLEWFFERLPVQVAYLACLASCVALPVALAGLTIRRMAVWRWLALLVVVSLLATVQGFALSVMVPVRS